MEKEEMNLETEKKDDKKYSAGIKTSAFESIAGIKVETI